MRHSGKLSGREVLRDQAHRLPRKLGVTFVVTQEQKGWCKLLTFRFPRDEVCGGVTADAQHVNALPSAANSASAAHLQGQKPMTAAQCTALAAQQTFFSLVAADAAAPSRVNAFTDCRCHPALCYVALSMEQINCSAAKRPSTECCHHRSIGLKLQSCHFRSAICLPCQSPCHYYA